MKVAAETRSRPAALEAVSDQPRRVPAVLPRSWQSPQSRPAAGASAAGTSGLPYVRSPVTAFPAINARPVAARLAAAAASIFNRRSASG